MSKFGKLDKKQIALLLTLASVLGGKASAMNTNKNQAKRSQSLGAASNNNSGANSKTLKRSKSMPSLRRKMGIGTKVAIGVGSVVGVAELANEGAAIFTDADTWYKGKISIINGIKHLSGDNMKPEEKQALAGKILDVIDTFDFEKVHSFKLPEYEGDKLDGDEKKAYDEKFYKACDNAVKEIKDAQGNSYIDRVNVQRYELGGVMSSGGVANTLNKYKALNVLNREYDRELLSDLKSGDFKYDKYGAKKVSFAKDKIRIDWGDGDFSVFELQKDGKLKVNFFIDPYLAGMKLVTEFILEKPKNEELKK